MSAPASTSARVPSADDHVAGDDRHLGRERADRAQRLEHPVLVAVRGVDDEAVDAGVEQRPRPWPATSPLTPTAAAIRSPPAASTAGA